MGVEGGESYSVKDLWGMPKALQRVLHKINQHNIN